MESENKYINKEHEGIVEQYVLYLKKLVYFATEDAGNMKFQEYAEILESVFMYSNNFYDTMTKKKHMVEEFMFLIPNMAFYLSVGFFTGLKNKNNAKDIEMCIDRLAKKTENITGELTDILIDNKEKIEIIEELNIES
jgi:hypothetical protein|tara:strand:- start:1143 stop:1556 length:414 start_codon:yes stop_codon:yes gene_type:complete